MLKVSFDFDDTLTEDGVWQYALELMDRNIEVWIVTARLDDDNIIKEFGKDLPVWADNDDLYGMAKSMNIPKNHIVFTNLLGKGSFFNKNPKFLWHLDDSIKQLYDVQYMSNVKPISVFNPNWKERCEKYLS